MDGKRFNVDGKVDWAAVSRHLTEKRLRQEKMSKMPEWTGERIDTQEDAEWEALEEIARMRKNDGTTPVRVDIKDL